MNPTQKNQPRSESLIKNYGIAFNCGVNGSAPKIEILKPLDEAFELMKKILFHPFDFKKWFVIGFAAFLAGHFAGMGFNFPIGGFPPNQTAPSSVSPDWDEWKPWLAILIVIGIVLFLALIVLFSWLRARGSFIFTDCIARNRAAIVDPWREYRREGNSYFLFLLAVMVVSMLIFGLFGLLGFLFFGLSAHNADNLTVTPLFIVLLVLFFLVWVCFAFFVGLISYFMVPLMYVRRCRALDAFRQTAKLVTEHLGSFILFCLFACVLLIAAVVVGGAATCATCCLAALPYIGTVILLPVFVCLRAYGLFFIRQFGRDYDVWAAIPTTTSPSPTEPPPLPS